MRKILPVLSAVLLFSAGNLIAEGQYEKPAVVASTGWAAAFAYAAGAEDVHVLAPYELKHPPEYELKPSDVTAVRSAEVIVYAGYENMVPRLKEAVGGRETELVQIVTQNDPATIEASVQKISSVLGTEEKARENLAEIRALFSAWREELKGAGVYGAPVVVHVFQKPLVEALGFKVVGTFGPAPLEANAIRDLSELRPLAVIDNRHNPVGMPLAETIPDSAYVSLYNFPPSREMYRLIDLLEMNRKLARETYR